MARVVVTCGPSYEPIDEVRRITNFSTGELGILLANRLAADGHDVICLRGVGATCPIPFVGVKHIPFTTNDDLFDRLKGIATSTGADAVFKVAALADFKVRTATDSQGNDVASAKISSRLAELTIHLEPARKVISELRGLFPKALLVGWKYEMAGDRETAMAKVWKQIQENKTDACVVNGRAFGPGFGFCTPPANIEPIPDKPAVVDFLGKWLAEQMAK